MIELACKWLVRLEVVIVIGVSLVHSEQIEGVCYILLSK